MVAWPGRTQVSEVRPGAPGLFPCLLFLVGGALHGFRFARQKPAEAVERAGLAEDFQAFKQGWRLGAASQDRPQEHEVFFHRPLFGRACGAYCGIDAVVSPLCGLNRAQRVVGNGAGL